MSYLYLENNPPVFIISLAMIAPALSFGFLSEFHLLSLFLGIIVFFFFNGTFFFAENSENKILWISCCNFGTWYNLHCSFKSFRLIFILKANRTVFIRIYAF